VISLVQLMYLDK